MYTFFKHMKYLILFSLLCSCTFSEYKSKTSRSEDYANNAHYDQVVFLYTGFYAGCTASLRHRVYFYIFTSEVTCKINDNTTESFYTDIDIRDSIKE